MAQHGLRPGDPERFGRFTLTGRLGAGGMGVAFAAETADGQRVVVKTVLSDLADDAEYRSRFRREVLAASSVESPFVAQVLASDVSAERQWVAIEYVDGPTLAELVDRDGPLDPSKQLALAVGLADALSHLHACGLIHRDLKPANIICTSTGPRLIDFGIAVVQQLPHVTRAGALAPGSAGWMAPEQLDPDAVPTPAIDLFAWGCLCWYAATGASPLAATDKPASYEALRTWSTATLQVPSTVAPQLVPWLRRALSPEPAHRGSAADYATGLTHAAGDDAATETLVTDAWQRTAPLGTAEMHRTVQVQDERRWPSTPQRWRVVAATALTAAVVAVAAVAVAQATGAQPEGRDRAAPTPSALDQRSQSPQATDSDPATSATDDPSPSTVLSPETSEPSPPAPSQTLRPLPGYGGAQRVGYGAVKLGMTRRQLLATGETLDVEQGLGTCTAYPMRAGGTATFSEGLGRVVYIQFAENMRTSTGIGLGSTQTEALNAYPDYRIDPTYNAIYPVIASHVTYMITLSGGYVADIVLLSDRQDCAS